MFPMQGAVSKQGIPMTTLSGFTDASADCCVKFAFLTIVPTAAIYVLESIASTSAPSVPVFRLLPRPTLLKSVILAKKRTLYKSHVALLSDNKPLTIEMSMNLAVLVLFAFG
jgi:hypothetical protein